MNYHDELTKRGWFRVACGKCAGSKKYSYHNLSRPKEVVEILYAQGMFRYKVNSVKVTFALLKDLLHQHFMQP